MWILLFIASLFSALVMFYIFDTLGITKRDFNTEGKCGMLGFNCVQFVVVFILCVIKEVLFGYSSYTGVASTVIMLLIIFASMFIVYDISFVGALFGFFTMFVLTVPVDLVMTLILSNIVETDLTYLFGTVSSGIILITLALILKQTTSRIYANTIKIVGNRFGNFDSLEVLLLYLTPVVVLFMSIQLINSIVSGNLAIGTYLVDIALLAGISTIYIVGLVVRYYKRKQDKIMKKHVMDVELERAKEFFRRD